MGHSHNVCMNDPLCPTAEATCGISSAETMQVGPVIIHPMKDFKLDQSKSGFICNNPGVLLDLRPYLDPRGLLLYFPSVPLLLSGSRAYYW